MSLEQNILDTKGNKAIDIIKNFTANIGPFAVAAAGGIVTTIQEFSRGEQYIFNSNDHIK